MKNSVKKIVAAIICCVVPVFFLVLGLLYLARGGLPEPGFMTAYVYIPLGAIVFLCLAIFLLKNLTVKIVLCIAILVLYVLFDGLYLILAPLGKIEVYAGQEAVNSYNTDASVSASMPEIGDLGTYETISFYNHWEKGAFPSDTDVLILSYEENAYLKQKASVESTYSFLSEPITYGTYHCEPSLIIDGYSFRVVDLDHNQYGYPKHMLLVGYNDVTCEIVYMYHLDPELDYISSLEEFVTQICWWTYICKMD